MNKFFTDMVNKILVNNNDSNYTHSIFDISEYTGNSYNTLSDALDDVPQPKQKGGMTVRYVLTDDNNYVKFFCTSDEFTTDVTKWQGIDDIPTAGSVNLVKSDGIASVIYNYQLIGNDNSYVYTPKYKVKPGCTYRFLLGKTNIDTSGVSYGETYTWFSIRRYDINGDRIGSDTEDLVNRKLDDKSALNDYYDFDIPNDTYYVAVYLRATQNEELKVWIEDITVNRTSALNFSVIGRNRDFIEIPIRGAIHGSKALIALDNTLWDVTATGNNQVILGIYYYDRQGNMIPIKRWYKLNASEIKNVIQFSIPNDCDYLSVGIRADKGVNVSFHITYYNGYDLGNYPILSTKGKVIFDNINHNIITSRLTIKYCGNSLQINGTVLSYGTGNDVFKLLYYDVNNSLLKFDSLNNISDTFNQEIIPLNIAYIKNSIVVYTENSSVSTLIIPSNDICVRTLNTLDFEKGTIYNGAFDTSSSCIRTKKLIKAKDFIAYSESALRVDTNSWYFRIVEYDKNGNYIYNPNDWTSNIQNYHLRPNCAFIRVVLRLTNSQGQSVDFSGSISNIYTDGEIALTCVYDGLLEVLSDNVDNILPNAINYCDNKYVGTKITFTPNMFYDVSGSIGSVASLTPTQDVRYESSITECTAGDLFFVNASAGGNSAKACVFLNSEDVILYQDLYIKNGYVTAPSGSAKIVISNKDLNNYGSFKVEGANKILTIERRVSILESLNLDYSSISRFSSGNNEFETSFNLNIPLFREASPFIITTYAKYVSQSDSVPTIKIKIGNIYISPAYTIGGNGVLSLKQCRIPPVIFGQSLDIEFDIPEGCVLTIMNFSCVKDCIAERKTFGTRLDAHLGFSSLAPENTIIAYELANICCFEGCIVNPIFSADNTPYCYHEDKSILTLDGENYVSLSGNDFHSLSDEQLALYKVGGNVAQRVLYSEPIPKLEDFFILCAKTGLSPMFSVHPRLTNEQWVIIKNMLVKYKLLNSLIVKSDTISYMESAFSILGNIKGFIYFVGGDNVQVYIDNLQNSTLANFSGEKGIEFKQNLITQEIVDTTINSGFFVSANNLKNMAIERYNELINMGVSEFCDDYNSSSCLNW